MVFRGFSSLVSGRPEPWSNPLVTWVKDYRCNLADERPRIIIYGNTAHHSVGSVALSGIGRFVYGPFCFCEGGRFS